jgi:hypothetical protein
LLGVLALGLGCQTVETDTCDFATDDLSAVAVVVDRGDVVRAEIDFEAGDRAVDAEPLSICEEETLRINGETPTRTDKAQRIVYSANLAATERTVTFSLERDDGDMSMAIDLPDAFEIVAPEPGAMLSRAAETIIAWDPPRSGEQLRIELGEEIGGGVCIFTEEGPHHYKKRGGVDVPDEGMWTIPGGSVHSDTDGPCVAYYTFQRIVQGTYPDVLHPGGYIEAQVERTITFASVP